MDISPLWNLHLSMNISRWLSLVEKKALQIVTNGLAAYAIARLSGVAPCKGLATAPQVVKKDRANGETAGG